MEKHVQVIIFPIIFTQEHTWNTCLFSYLPLTHQVFFSLLDYSLISVSGWGFRSQKKMLHCRLDVTLSKGSRKEDSNAVCLHGRTASLDFICCLRLKLPARHLEQNKQKGNALATHCPWGFCNHWEHLFKEKVPVPLPRCQQDCKLIYELVGVSDSRNEIIYSI